MSYANPYASPQVANPFSETYSPVAPQGFPGLWRQGNLLVLHKLAPLPDICLKSNLPANRRLKRKLSWHPPAVFLAILLHILVYIIIAMIMQKKATLMIPLTEEWYQRRKNRMKIAWGLIFIGMLMIGGGVGLAANENAWGLLLLVGGILGSLIAAIYGLVACRLVSTSRITDEYVWLKGVHPEFLDRLPIWPYNI